MVGVRGSTETELNCKCYIHHNDVKSVVAGINKAEKSTETLLNASTCIGLEAGTEHNYSRMSVNL